MWMHMYVKIDCFRNGSKNILVRLLAYALIFEYYVHALIFENYYARHCVTADENIYWYVLTYRNP